MKRIFRTFVISTVSLYVANRIFPDGLVWNNNLITLLTAGAGLTIANMLVKPLFSLIMLPINLLTFGMFRWVTNVILLFIVVKFIDGISVQPFKFSGFTYSGVVIPEISFGTITAWIAITFVLSIVSGWLIWLVKK